MHPCRIGMAVLVVGTCVAASDAQIQIESTARSVLAQVTYFSHDVNEWVTLTDAQSTNEPGPWSAGALVWVEFPPTALQGSDVESVEIGGTGEAHVFVIEDIQTAASTIEISFLVVAAAKAVVTGQLEAGNYSALSMSYVELSDSEASILERHVSPFFPDGYQTESLPLDEAIVLPLGQYTLKIGATASEGPCLGCIGDAMFDVAVSFFLLGDLNDDGHVNGSDLGIVLGLWGPCSGSCLGDVDGSGAVDGADLGLLLANWTG